jgi:1-phosphofructokinase
MIVSVTPNPALDRTIEVSRLRPGELHRVRRATVEPGGKGINVARVLAARGIATEAVFPSGGSEGDALLAVLRTQRIQVRPVAIAAPLRTNIAIVEPGGEVTKLNEPGPELTDSDARALIAAVREAARDADWVVSCGSLPRGLSIDFHAEIVATAHAQGAKAAVDASGGALQAALAARPDLIKPNRDELEEAVGWTIATLGDAVLGARELLGRGAAQVLASLGGEGAILVDERLCLYGSAPCEAVRSTVGAGDTLLAGFVAGDGGAESALRQAVEWAAQSVATPGNGIPGPGSALAATGIVSAALDLERSLDGVPSGEQVLVGEASTTVDRLAKSTER